MGFGYLENLVRETIEAGKHWEGSADSAELEFLSGLANQPGVKLIGEIGFNAGLSSYAMLAANLEARINSFDLGEHEYVRPAKEYIDKEFSDRHSLIIGSSFKTVPEFYLNNRSIKFDLIFIDGGHDYEVAQADLTNMKKLASKDTLLVVDDLTPWKPWGEGPARAWREAIEYGFVVQMELWKDGKRVEQIEPLGDRSWALGRYVF